tara:strand:- start:258 stop:689 length:432 start_codon:yes stop_codon:yes gene_type:complete
MDYEYIFNNEIPINEDKLVKENSSNIIEIDDDEIIEIDNLLAGLIYVKKKYIWKKKYFVVGDKYFDYWKSNKYIKNRRVRVKEKSFELNFKMELSCLKKITHNDKAAWSFNVYKNDNFYVSFMSYNEKINDVYQKMKNIIYFL